MDWLSADLLALFCQKVRGFAQKDGVRLRVDEPGLLA